MSTLLWYKIYSKCTIYNQLTCKSILVLYSNTSYDVQPNICHSRVTFCFCCSNTLPDHSPSNGLILCLQNRDNDTDLWKAISAPTLNSTTKGWVLLINPKLGMEQENCNSLALITRKSCCFFTYFLLEHDNQIQSKDHTVPLKIILQINM